MSFKTKLQKGALALATIGALGAGSFLAAAPASAAIFFDEYQAMKPGAQDVQTRVEWHGPLVQYETLRFQIDNGATFGPQKAAFAGVVMVAETGYDMAGQRYRDCALSDGDTVMTCTFDGGAAGPNYDWQGDRAAADWRANVQVFIPASARPADTFPITVTTVDQAGNQTGHGTKTPYIADIEPITVVSPADQSTIAASGTVFTGTSHRGAVVVIKDAAGNEIGRGTADANGNWSITATGQLSLGLHDLTFTETAPDALGNDMSKSTTGSYLVVEEEEEEGVPAIDPLYAGIAGAALLAAAFGIRRRVKA